MSETNDPKDSHEHRRPSPETTEYPPVLRLTAVASDEHVEEMLDRADRAAAGEQVPSVRNFADPT